MRRRRNRAQQARACAYCGIAAILTLVLTGCHPSGLPKPDTKAYLDEVTAFYVGLAALQVGDDVRADATLERATQLAPGEPAGWANWGLLALRQGNFDASAQRLGQAQKLAPQNGQLHYFSGVLESRRGNPSQAIAELRKAVQITRVICAPCICWPRKLSVRAMPTERPSFSSCWKRFSSHNRTIQPRCWNSDE